MIETALKYGFRKDHLGCPCSGSPQICLLEHNGKTYTLTLWTKRDIWKLATCGYTIASGKGPMLEPKLKEILWD